jgi:hypothetical protein
MLFDEHILLVHVPKTAGDSVTKFLIDNLPGFVKRTAAVAMAPGRTDKRQSATEPLTLTISVPHGNVQQKALAMGQIFARQTPESLPDCRIARRWSSP